MKHLFQWTLIAVLGGAAASTQAQDAPSKSSAAASANSAQTAMTEGEVKKIDKDAAKLTIKHGPLVNLDMPGMTMVFRVNDPAMLDLVKPGDKIRFVADKINGAFTVMKLEAAE